MVLDTSAIVAILFDEPERDTFSRLLASEPILVLSAGTHVEAAVVAAAKKRSPLAFGLLDQLIGDLAMQVVPLDLQASLVARDAYLRFGRGYHRANLNLGDCFSYALAKLRDEPLLFKGDDFLHTDVVPAWRP